MVALWKSGWHHDRSDIVVGYASPRSRPPARSPEQIFCAMSERDCSYEARGALSRPTSRCPRPPRVFARYNRRGVGSSTGSARILGRLCGPSLLKMYGWSDADSEALPLWKSEPSTQLRKSAAARSSFRIVVILHFASGSGRIWKCTAIGFLPLPPSISHGVRSPLVVHNPRPFQPAFGSSMRPSSPLA